MKVVHVTPRYFPNIGGVETVVKELCENLATKGIDVTVYSLDLVGKNRKRESLNDVSVRRYRPLIGDPLFLPPLSFLMDLRRERSAIIHVHNIHNIFPLFVSLFKTINQFLVVQPHYHRYGQTLPRHMLLSLYKIAIPKLVTNRAQVIVANSRYEERILKEDFSLKKNILTVPEGLPLQELRAVSHRPEVPERILYAGALRKYKKVDIMLRALKILLAYEPGSFKLVIIGSGPEKENLMKLASNLRIEESVEWKRELSRQQLLSEYGRTKVFVFLSQLESFSRVVNEAVSLGIPTVVPKGNLFLDLVNHGVAEEAIPDDPESVATAILLARKKHISLTVRESLCFNDAKEYADVIATIYRSLGSRVGW
jgi:glycosyltransferase involved in cell wall biosynthesis